MCWKVQTRMLAQIQGEEDNRLQWFSLSGVSAESEKTQKKCSAFSLRGVGPYGRGGCVSSVAGGEEILTAETRRTQRD